MTEQFNHNSTAKYEHEFALVAIAEASGLHKGHWTLMEVTEFDEDHIPSKGITRLTSKSRRRITEESLKLRDSYNKELRRGRPFYVFHATPGELSPLDLIIGANFFENYTDIHLNIPTSRAILIDP